MSKIPYTKSATLQACEQILGITVALIGLVLAYQILIILAQ